MPGTTTRLALPYPVPDDTTDVPRDVKALAEKLDQVVVTPEPGDLKFSARVSEHGNWIKADGRTLIAGQYDPLRSALIADGSPFGADAGNPKLPDMRGRTPVGAGTGAGLTARAAGQAGGAEAHALSVAQMPSHAHGGTTGWQSNDHSHQYQADAHAGTANFAGGGLGHNYEYNYTANTGGVSSNHYHAIGAEGGGAAHPQMPPFTVGTWFVYAAA